MSFFTRDRDFYKSFISLTSVIALQNLITFSVNLADNIMLGGYSETALSGVAIVNQIQFLLHMLVMGTANGMVVIASQYWGKRETEPIKKVFAVVFWLDLAIGIIFMLLGFFMPGQLCSLLTNELPVIAEGVKYLKIVCFSYGVFAVTTVLLGTLRSVEVVKIGFAVSALALVVNVFLNYSLIYGHFGFPELGVEGAAIATLISRIAELSVVVVYALFVDKRLRLRLRDTLSVRREYVKDYVRSGLPVGLSSGSWGVAMAVQTAILGRLGTSVIAASSIASTILQVVSVFAYGTGTSSQIIIGKAVGAGKTEKIKEYSRTLQVLYVIIGVASGLALCAIKNPVLSFYNVSDETAELAGRFVIVLCFIVVGTAYEMPCLGGIVGGGGDTKFVLYNDIIFMWCIVIPMSFVSAFVLELSPVITFFCLKSDQITKCVVAIFKVNRYRWIKNLTR
ncbi:MAG: MATE family efflux transporter [Clostridiales bacterium]|nr:MATE family efflux transporter [Clostridiales bacterium]